MSEEIVYYCPKCGHKNSTEEEQARKAELALLAMKGTNTVAVFLATAFTGGLFLPIVFGAIMSGTVGCIILEEGDGKRRCSSCHHKWK